MSDEKRLILCIDDDPDILSFLQVVLEVYKEIDPDLIIVDLMMEEVDAGTGFAKELRILQNTAPVFMLSSVGDDLSMTTDYTELGLAGVFQKPLMKEHLLAVLKAKLA